MLISYLWLNSYLWCDLATCLEELIFLATQLCLIWSTPWTIDTITLALETWIMLGIEGRSSRIYLRKNICRMIIYCIMIAGSIMMSLVLPVQECKDLDPIFIPTRGTSDLIVIGNHGYFPLTERQLVEILDHSSTTIIH